MDLLSRAGRVNLNERFRRQIKLTSLFIYLYSDFLRNTIPINVILVFISYVHMNFFSQQYIQTKSIYLPKMPCNARKISAKRQACIFLIICLSIIFFIYLSIYIYTGCSKNVAFLHFLQFLSVVSNRDEKILYKCTLHCVDNN